MATTRPAVAAPAQGHRGELYYFDRCAACDRMNGIHGETPSRLYDGRDVRYCSNDCIAAFERDLTGSLARLDRKMADDQRPCYPTDTSIVSGKPLAAATAVELVWCNRLVRLADPTEKATFLADPDRYVKTLDELAVERQLPHYRTNKCAVRGDELEPELDARATIVLAGRMLRLCCSDCAAGVRNHPSNYYGIADYIYRHGAARPAAAAGGR
jgi:hypothetical protein